MLKLIIYSIIIVGDFMFENKKIFILGMARSGYEAAKVLIKRNCMVILNDNKNEDSQNKEQVENRGISYF